MAIEGTELHTGAPGAARTGAVAAAAPLPLDAGIAAVQLADLIQLTKPRVTSLVVATAFTGFYLASSSPLAFGGLLHTLTGTWLVASAAAVMNQVYESDTDRLMRRTRQRPLPSNRVSAEGATTLGTLLGVVGLLELGLGTNVLAASLALLTLAIYVGVYTPLKLRTPAALEIGAIPGALPPVIGWAAAHGNLHFGALVLFAILFFWQMPHFLAIAWMCRDDYERAGIPMLPVVEPEGRITAVQVVLYSAVLLPVSLLPAVTGLAGTFYSVSAAALGIGFFVLALGFARARDLSAARRLFLGSVVYLPLLWAAMLLNH